MRPGHSEKPTDARAVVSGAQAAVGNSLTDARAVVTDAQAKVTGARVMVWGYKNKKKNNDRRRERSSFFFSF